jgi:hypothetical protein
MNGNRTRNHASAARRTKPNGSEEKRLNSENGAVGGRTQRRRCLKRECNRATRSQRMHHSGGNSAWRRVHRMVGNARGSGTQRRISRLHPAAIAAVHHHRRTAVLHGHALAASGLPCGCQAGERRRSGPQDHDYQQYERAPSAHVHSVRRHPFMSIRPARLSPQ